MTQPNTRTKHNSHYDIVILGAGLSGVLTALELPSHYSIALIDIGDEIIHSRSTSYNQCNKLHLGLHYAGDKNTALKCLEDSLRFASKYKEYLLGEIDEPSRRGRHFIMSNSLFGLDQIQEVCSSLLGAYTQQAAASDYVFGKPENFIRILKKTHYPELAKIIPQYASPSHHEAATIQLGIETGESQINIAQLKHHLKSKITLSQNITFIPNHKISTTSFNPLDLSYTVTAKNIKNFQEIEIVGGSIVNATWHSIENIDARIADIPEDRLIRVKASLLVELPVSLRKLNTCIFSIGPFCSFTNLGNGMAIITEETASNLGHYFSHQEPDHKLKSLIDAPTYLENSFGKQISIDILSKASSYIPQLSYAKIAQLHLGYVKIATEGKPYSLNSVNSPIHARNESGVEQIGLGYISAAGMKMTYTYHNALLVREKLEHHHKVRAALTEIISNKNQTAAPSFSKNTQKANAYGFKSLLKISLATKLGISLQELSSIFPECQLSEVIKAHPHILEKNVIIPPFLLSAA